MFVGLPISRLCLRECLMLCVRIAPTFFSSHPNIGGCVCSIPFKHAHAPAHTNMSCPFLILFFRKFSRRIFSCTQLIWGLFKYCKNLICCRKRIKYLNIDYGTCVRSLVHSIVLHLFVRSLVRAFFIDHLPEMVTNENLWILAKFCDCKLIPNLLFSMFAHGHLSSLRKYRVQWIEQ